MPRLDRAFGREAEISVLKMNVVWCEEKVEGGGKSEIHGGVRGTSAGVLCTLALWMLQDFFPPTAQQPPVDRVLTITLRHTTLCKIPPVE